MLKLPNGTIRVLVEGLKRAHIVKYNEHEDYTSVDIQLIHEDDSKDTEDEALMRTLLDHFDQYIKISKKSRPKRTPRLLISKSRGEWQTSLLLICPLN